MNITALDKYNGCEACDYRGFKKFGDRRMSCDCMVQRRETEQLYMPLMLRSHASLYKRMTFGTYVPENETERDAKQTMACLLSGFYVFGKFGVGKTHLLAAMVNELRRRHVPAVLFTIREILNIMGDRSRDGQVLQRQLMNIHYLVVDDLGKEWNTAPVREHLFELVDKRYLLATTEDHGYTSFTSQTPHDCLRDKYSEAIVSRIKGMTCSMAIRGRSRRQQDGGRVAHYAGREK